VPASAPGQARRRGQGELEVQVLSALRRATEPATAGWVQEQLGGGLAYTTVMTILTRLQAKGAVTRRRAGRSFRWTPTAEPAGLAALRMRRVLDGEPDREAVLASFVTALSPGDERLLRDLLGQAGAYGDGAEGVEGAGAGGPAGARSGPGPDPGRGSGTERDSGRAPRFGPDGAGEPLCGTEPGNGPGVGADAAAGPGTGYGLGSDPVAGPHPPAAGLAARPEE
jgi:predicted transcriptional regulator